MKAAIREKYGGPEVISIQEVEAPVPGSDEVLVRVEAVSLNASDWEFLTGSPAYVRAWGLWKPRVKILGSDVVGRVEAVGSKVTQLRPGDEVYGDIMETFGGLAEFVCAKERLWMKRPPGLRAEELAAVPQAALVAWQGLQERGRLASGERVAIIGAGGGSGSFAIQFAKAMRAHVTAVDRADKSAFMKELGADETIDYQTEDLACHRAEFDVILDLVARRSFRHFSGALRPGGRYVLVGGTVGCLLQAAYLGPLVSLWSDKEFGMLVAKPSRSDQDRIIEFIRGGQVRPVIDQIFSFGQVADALRHVGEYQARGKVIVKL